MTAEVKLETTAEERAKWSITNYEKAIPGDSQILWHRIERLCRDIATLLAEVARLSTQLQIANAEIVRLSASREEIRERLESKVARLKAELADAKDAALKAHAKGWNDHARLSLDAGRDPEATAHEVARLKAELAEAHAHILTDREELAACMIRRSLATGHGDTLNDLLRELDWQLAEATTREAAARAEGFEAGAKLARSAP